MARDYIPHSSDAFNAWQSNFTDIVSQKLNSWEIDPEMYKPITRAQSDWNEVYPKATASTNRTQADVLARNEQQDIYTKSLRLFIKQQVANNPRVSDFEKERLGLTVPSPSRTPSQVPVSSPVVEIVSGHLLHTLHFRNSGSADKAKPAGVHGCEIWTGKGAMPVSDAGYSYLATDTATPYVVKFDLNESGVTAWYRLRWVNTRGETGPWSAVVSAVIA
ncbi:MAG: hypothetical protein LBR75_05070 [Prevotellaceae bacterium]|jgi:hypothetical protein|nr:hypothetical protein [Prevotellaceae bacterium]